MSMSAGTGDTTSSFLSVVVELMVLNWDSVCRNKDSESEKTNDVCLTMKEKSLHLFIIP